MTPGRECRLSCILEGVACGEDSRWRPSAIRLHLLSLPRGVPARTPLLRLSAFDGSGAPLRNARFAIRNAAAYSRLPFAIR